jgi:hypothetical protein
MSTSKNFKHLLDHPRDEGLIDSSPSSSFSDLADGPDEYEEPAGNGYGKDELSKAKRPYHSTVR